MIYINFYLYIEYPTSYDKHNILYIVYTSTLTYH